MMVQRPSSTPSFGTELPSARELVIYQNRASLHEKPSEFVFDDNDCLSLSRGFRRFIDTERYRFPLYCTRSICRYCILGLLREQSWRLYIGLCEKIPAGSGTNSKQFNAYKALDDILYCIVGLDTDEFHQDVCSTSQ